MKNDQCVVAVYESFDKASQAIKTLEQSRFPHHQVSLAAHSVPERIKREPGLECRDKTEQDAMKGAGVGGLIGLLLGAPLLAIPGFGPLLIAGPLAAGATGAIVGGFLGALAGWGVHEDRVKQYEEKVKGGKLLVVATGPPDQVASAKRVLTETEADEVHLHATTADGPEVPRA